LRRAGKRADLGRQPIRREIVLAQPQRPAGGLQHTGIGELVLIERVRQRHQYGWPPDRREFRHGRGAGARDDDMARGDPRRQIGEERRDLGRNVCPCIDLRHACEILLARLLHQCEARLHIMGKPFDRGRDDIGHDARTLAAAEYQKPNRARRFRGDIGNRRRGDDRRPHRIAGPCRLDAQLGLAVEHSGEAGRDGIDPRCEKPVGTPHHRILLVNDRGNSAQRRRQHGRNGRIAAEPDNRGWPHAHNESQALYGARAEHRRRAHQRERVASAHGRAGDDVNIARRKRSAVALSAIVGGESSGDAAPGERLRECFGGK
jgi:hypothetical protein